MHEFVYADAFIEGMRFMLDERRQQLEHLTTAGNQVHSIPSGGWTQMSALWKWRP